MSRFRLPETLTDPGDPITGNPFDILDARHKVWAEATREAEEEVARINARVLSHASKVGDGMSILFNQLNAWGAKFDAWARRGIKVVWSDEEMRAYERWLLDYANARLELTEHFFGPEPSYVPTETLLFRLRNLLASRVQYWKAEVRRYRTEQESRAQAPFEPPSTVSYEVVVKRKRLLREFRRARDLTAPDFARLAGMSDTSIRAVVAEDRERGFANDTRDRLLGVLGVALRDWYS